ncbi:unnamed protein product [Oncorhynchus mykiss]|uniref:PID domain-containing protein n=1 Tax=Oncorhynchus mykiss TaxID=8022 RepID=A0A060XCK3_ONCMY|nr:unnamed protein product [Oncorhynchus mykiss]
MHVCEEAVKKLKIDMCRLVGLSDTSGKKTVKAVLWVSADGLRVVDDKTKDLIVDQTIEKVSFCAPDRNYDKAFSYICRDGTTRRWICHCFMALKDSGERMSHAVGCAFAACLERKQRREKECGVTASFDASRTSFVREGSFRMTSSSQQGGERDDITKQLQDKKKEPPCTIPAIPPGTSSPPEGSASPVGQGVEHAIPRRHAPIEQLVRQGSFRGFPALSGKNSPFKRQLSLRLNDLPSNLQRKTADFQSKNPVPEMDLSVCGEADSSINALCSQINHSFTRPSEELFSNPPPTACQPALCPQPSPLPLPPCKPRPPGCRQSPRSSPLHRWSTVGTGGRPPRLSAGWRRWPRPSKPSNRPPTCPHHLSSPPLPFQGHPCQAHLCHGQPCQGYLAPCPLPCSPFPWPWRTPTPVCLWWASRLPRWWLMFSARQAALPAGLPWAWAQGLKWARSLIPPSTASPTTFPPPPSPPSRRTALAATVAVAAAGHRRAHSWPTRHQPMPRRLIASRQSGLRWRPNRNPRRRPTLSPMTCKRPLRSSLNSVLTQRGLGFSQSSTLSQLQLSWHSSFQNPVLVPGFRPSISDEAVSCLECYSRTSVECHSRTSVECLPHRTGLIWISLLKGQWLTVHRETKISNM